MKDSENEDTDIASETFEKSQNPAEFEKYVLRLFVTGTTPKSAQAIQNIQKICEELLEGRYRLEVIDIYQQPEKAIEAQIVAVPTLIKQLPFPLRKIVGNLSDVERVITSLGLHVEKSDDAISKGV
ncbi:circadian clock KaiB family protein [Candidatus Chlorohelix sp.]|uniref:circadian clock KaiB family protein n=1 Tax=Candidatus Chlorohelix sp. TaxID=3139201 RepID=UPI00306F99A0